MFNNEVDRSALKHHTFWSEVVRKDLKRAKVLFPLFCYLKSRWNSPLLLINKEKKDHPGKAPGGSYF